MSSSVAPIVLAHEFGTAEWTWAVTAELLVLVWAGLLLLAPRWGGGRAPGSWFRLIGLGAALLASGLAWVGKTVEVWPGHPLFPSGHTAWAATIAVLLVARDRRWVPWVLVLLALVVAALLLANYHEPLEILGGAGVGLLTGLGGVALLQHTSQPAAATRVRRSPTRDAAP